MSLRPHLYLPILFFLNKTYHFPAEVIYYFYLKFTCKTLNKCYIYRTDTKSLKIETGKAKKNVPSGSRKNSGCCKEKE